jgi:hypothetical protein
MNRAVLSVTLASGIAGGAAAAWPVWGDDFAKREVQEFLDARFDTAEIGRFELERHSASLHDVVLHSGAIEVRLDQVDVALDLAWDGHVTVSDVQVRGGTVSGDVSEAEDLLKQDQEQVKSASGDRRVSTEGASVAAVGIALSVTHESASLTGVLAATKIEEGISIKLLDGRVTRGEREATFASASWVLHKSDVFPLTVSLQGLSTHVTPHIAVSSVEGSVTLDDRNVTSLGFDLKGMSNDGVAAWSVVGVLDRAAQTGDIKLSVERVEAGHLPGFVEALPFKLDPTSRLYGESDVVWSGDEIRIRGAMGMDNASIEHPMLATTPVHDISFVAEVDLSVRPSKRRIEITKTQVKRGKVVLAVDGVISRSEKLEERLYQLHVHMPETPCQDVLDAVPDELVPGLKGFKLGGKAGVDLKINVAPATPEATVLEGDIGIDGCKLIEVPSEVSNLDGPFIHQVRRKDGHVQPVYLMEGRELTDFDSIAPTMAAAVLTTEDGGFWRHDGFLRSQFEAALRRNVELGKIRRGASTITMQMVKNVLLSHERTVSRKIQELFLTWVIEERLPKKRIMEIYLNVVEFGPGIYGITRAAQHYFAKHPSELNGKESAFLATLLPSPIRRHEQWCYEQPTEKYLKKVDLVFNIMHARKRIDDATWEADKDTALVFSRSEWFGPAACIVEGRDILNAKGVQWAESGLLSGRGTSLTEEVTAEDVDVDALLEDE